MKPESELKLSFYKELNNLGNKENVYLVQHVETSEIFVKKIMPISQAPVYDYLYQNPINGIPKIIEIIKVNNDLIVVEEHINGRTLEQEESFTEERALRIFTSICETLEVLHSANPTIIHRDIKPSNIIINREDKPYVIDFDASKTVSPDKTRDTVLMGTCDYAAPEQYGFRQSDVRTDIYALGVLLNRMLTGQLPNQITPVGKLGIVIVKCTAMEPDFRYQSVRELLSAIASYTKTGVNGSVYKEFNEANSHIKSFSTSWAIPGFRKRNPLHMCISTLWYVIIIAAGCTMEVTDKGHPVTGIDLTLNRIFCVVAFTLATFYCANYRGIADRFPRFTPTTKIGVIIKRAGFGLVCVAIPAAILVLIEQFLLY